MNLNNTHKECDCLLPNGLLKSSCFDGCDCACHKPHKRINPNSPCTKKEPHSCNNLGCKCNNVTNQSDCCNTLTVKTNTHKGVEEIKEKLAEIEHARWSDWQKYCHSRGIEDNQGYLCLPMGLVKQWERQIATPYAELSEEEKQSDRDQVGRYWHLVDSLISQAKREEAERMTTVVENMLVEKAHTYGSENADVYRAYDRGQEYMKKKILHSLKQSDE